MSLISQVSGRVFLVYLAEVLLKNYETNAYIRKMLDTTRVGYSDL